MEKCKYPDCKTKPYKNKPYCSAHRRLVTEACDGCDLDDRFCRDCPVFSVTNTYDYTVEQYGLDEDFLLGEIDNGKNLKMGEY